MRLFFTLLIVFAGMCAKAQCTVAIVPASASVSCTGSNSAISFTATSTGTGTVRHDWYSPYNPLPGGQPVFTSTGVTSVLSGSFAPGLYQLVTTHMPSMCIYTSTFSITSPFAFPTFTASNATPTLDCTSLQTTLNILGAVSNDTPVASCSYTFLPPTFIGTVNPSFTLSPIPTTVTSIAGTWTIMVRDDGNACRNVLPVPVYQNTVQPSLFVAPPNRTLTCNSPTLLGVATTTTQSTSIVWSTPSGSTLNTGTITLGQPTGPATSSLTFNYATYSLNAFNMTNGCSTTSYVTIYQDFKPPTPVPVFIGTNTVIYCNLSNNVVLGDNSTSNSNNPGASITNRCWGIYPTANTCGPTTYTVNTPGLYIFSASDSFNGCIASQTISVSSSGQLNATMAHTVGLGGQTSFSNTTANINNSTTCVWSFGDGFSTLGNTTSHAYASAGVYTVSLVVYKSPACKDSISQAVNVTGLPCIANAGFSIVPTGTSQYWTIIPAYPWNISNASWNWGDGFTSNGLYSSHSYSVPGNYNVCLSVTVSCGATASTCVTYSVNTACFVEVVQPGTKVIGIDEQENAVSSILIYPNPSNGRFNLSFSKGGLYSVTLYNMSGELIYAGKLDVADNAHEEIEIEPGTIAEGIYFLQIRHSNLVFNKKLVITR